MVYVDTSALVPIFIREAKSQAVLDWVESSGERLAISEWSLVEFSSAAAIKVRTGQATAALASQAAVRAREFARTHCVVAVPGREEFCRAADLAGNPGLRLRAGDALHIALALSLKVQAVLSLDDAMSEGARALGLRAVSI